MSTDEYWCLLRITADCWWLLMTTGDYWYLLVICDIYWWLLMVWCWQPKDISRWPQMTPNWLKMRSGRLLTPHFLKNVNSHETSAGVVFGALLGAQDGAKIDPRSPQDGSKIVLDRFFHLLIFRFDFLSFLAPFWADLASQRGTPELGITLGGGPGILGKFEVQIRILEILLCTRLVSKNDLSGFAFPNAASVGQ